MAHDVDLQPDTYFAVEIAKVEDQPDGTVMVYGVPANPETLDNDEQIADEGWLKQALPDWFHSYANVREMHQPIAAGTATKLDWTGDKPQIAAKIVNPDSVAKVKHKVLKAFSIGVKRPETRRDPKARNGRIVGGKIVEVSLVDRPSIPGSDIESFKAAVKDGLMLVKAVGMNEWLDAQTGTVIQDRIDEYGLEPDTTGGDMSEKTVEGDAVKRDFDPDVGGGVDRDKIPAEDFAGKDRSYPIVKPGDVSDAARSIGRAGGDNYSSDTLKENIIRIAHRKGPAFIAELPEAWRDSGKAAATAEDAKGVEASIDKEASSDMDAENTDAAETKNGGSSDESNKSALALLEKAQADKTWCADCASMEKIVDGQIVKTGRQEMLVGTDAAGHELRKYVGKSDEVEKAAEDADDADKDGTMDDSGLGAGEEAASPDEEKTADAAAEKADDTVKDDGADTEKAEEGLAKVLAAADGDLAKAAILDLFADALGVDLGKVGRRMAAKRLQAFKDAVAQLHALAKDLSYDEDDADTGKAAGVGGPTLVDGNKSLADTALRDAVGLVARLCNELGDGDALGKDGDHVDGSDDMGTADKIRLAGQIDTNKSTDTDMTKQVTTDVAKIVGPELAKSVAQEISGIMAPLVERLEKVEHTVVEPRRPVLHAAERSHVLGGDTEKTVERSDELLKADLEKHLAGHTDQEREDILATVIAASRNWRR